MNQLDNSFMSQPPKTVKMQLFITYTCVEKPDFVHGTRRPNLTSEFAKHDDVHS